MQAARRLYNPTGKKLPLPTVVELNRRLVKGYTQYKDDPRIIQLKESVNKYNADLKKLGIRDHQVEWGNTNKRPWILVLATLIYRLGNLFFLAIGTLPGLAMFWPVFVATKLYSRKKSKEALAKSTVKLAGRDVISTWKLLMALALTPTLYAYYMAIITYWTYYNRQGGYYTYAVPWWMRARTFIPDFVPLWLVAIISMSVCIGVTFAALRIGEVGMDIVKSLPPLIVALNPRSSNRLALLRERRAQLSSQVTEIINTLGPEVYPNFDADRIVADPFKEGAYQSRLKRTDDVEARDAEPKTPTEIEVEEPTDSPVIPTGQTRLPRNESFGNIGSIGFFATRPPSGSRSRSSSTGGSLGSESMPLQSLSSMDKHGKFDEVTRKIRGAMKERGKERRRQTLENEGDGEIEESSDDDKAKKIR